MRLACYRWLGKSVAVLTDGAFEREGCPCFRPRRRRPRAAPCDPRNDGELDAAVDEVRTRFGNEALTRAVLLGRGEGLTMPLPPD